MRDLLNNAKTIQKELKQKKVQEEREKEERRLKELEEQRKLQRKQREAYGMRVTWFKGFDLKFLGELGMTHMSELFTTNFRAYKKCEITSSVSETSKYDAKFFKIRFQIKALLLRFQLLYIIQL